MAAKYFIATSGPIKSQDGSAAAARGLAGVFNGSTGTVRVHGIKARIPALGPYVQASLTGSSIASMPNGTLEVARCSAYGGGAVADAPLKCDTDADDCDVAWVDLPTTSTTDDAPLRAIENEAPPAFGSGGFPFSFNSLVGAPLSGRTGSSSAALFRCRSDADSDGLVLQPDEGLAVRASGESGTLGMQWLFTVTLVVGTSTYVYQRTVAPGYVGQPWFVLWNAGATAATVLRIEQHNTTSHFLPSGSHQGHMLRVSRSRYPTEFSVVSDVLPADTADVLPEDVLVFKDAECGGRLGMHATELAALDQADLVAAAPLCNFFLGRVGQIYPRLILPDPQNRDFGFSDLTGVILHCAKARPLVVPPGTGLCVFGSTFHTLSGNAFSMQLLGGAAVLDIEMVLSYEAAAPGAADTAFFG